MLRSIAALTQVSTTGQPSVAARFLFMTESWEDLVLPVLRIAKSYRESDLHQLIHAVKAQRGERERDPNTPLARMVGSAFAALLRSELLVSDEGRRKFKVSTAGLKILENPPARLDLPYLKTIPQYIAYGENHERDRQARGFQQRRFEYYTGGRRLFLNGAWQPALTLLAYAIEYHLKSPLAGIADCLLKGEKKQLKGHDLPELYDLAVCRGFFQNCRISSEFLGYAGDMFHMRYPSGEERVLGRRGGYRISQYLIFTYDDCIMQLDEALASDFGDPTLSMGVASCGGITSVPTSALLSESFFHCNPFALQNLERYKEIIEESDIRVQVDLPTTQEEGFAAPSLPRPHFRLTRYRRLVDFNLAADFRLPKPEEPDPDPAAAFLASNSGCHEETRRILGHLTEEFGDHRVTTRRDNRTGNLHAYVFSRRSKQWWRSLLLEERHLPRRFVPHGGSEAKELKAWVRETKSLFQDVATEHESALIRNC